MYAIATIVGSSYADSISFLKIIEEACRMASGGGSDPKSGGSSPPGSEAERTKEMCRPVLNIVELVALLPDLQYSFKCVAPDTSTPFSIHLPIRTHSADTPDIPYRTTVADSATLITSTRPDDMFVFSMRHFLEQHPGDPAPVPLDRGYRFTNAEKGGVSVIRFDDTAEVAGVLWVCEAVPVAAAVAANKRSASRRGPRRRVRSKNRRTRRR